VEVTKRNLPTGGVVPPAIAPTAASACSSN